MPDAAARCAALNMNGRMEMTKSPNLVDNMAFAKKRRRQGAKDEI
jgi:hypothetical protein